MQLLTNQMYQLPQGVQLALKKTVGKDIVMLVAQTLLPAGSSEALNLVRTIRESHPPVGGELMVTGESAFHVDFIETIKQNSPIVIGFIVLVTYSGALPAAWVFIAPSQGRADEHALHQRLLRRPGLDLPGRSSGHVAPLHAGSHRGNDPDHDVLHPVWPLDGLRGAAAKQGARGVLSKHAITPERWRGVWNAPAG